MFHKFSQRAQDEKGFTLIELLVVILIIGILAAIAIPSFLNQKSKANDAQAKEMVRTAQTAAETYATDHNGLYTSMQTSDLTGIEPTLLDTSGAKFVGVSGTSATGYTVEADSSNGNKYFITRNSSGSTSRTCSAASSPNSGGCVGGSW